MNQEREATDIEILPAQHVWASFDEVERRGLQPKLTMLDPWYNKGVGGIIDDYDYYINELLYRACKVSDHVYLWGFPEILGPYVRNIPSSHNLISWLTWYYKNNPSVIRGWRSAQMTCLHIARPKAKLYPESFLNSVQRQKLAEGKLRYLPGPASVIESPLLVGFVGKKEQTGHPAQKPIAVYDRLIRMATAEGETIFDPMCGSGTTGVVALIRQRKAILSDGNADYLSITRSRLDQDYAGWAERLDEICNNREGPKSVSQPRRSRRPRSKTANRATENLLPV